MVKQSVKGFKRVKVKKFDSLLIKFAKKERAEIILRGLREASDFPGEFTKAVINRKLSPKIETVFVMTNPDYFYINSGIVREIAFFGGKVIDFVPRHVEKKLFAKIKEK